MKMVHQDIELPPCKTCGPFEERNHTCAVCQTTSNHWCADWIWFGCYENKKGVAEVVKFCGPGCASKAKQLGLVPRDSPKFDAAKLAADDA
ncbi:hypothetical protein LCGC14_1801720 [marine sediment metagenome]|uniref:Uncharacterized protein n=1 Tax=marine sediment metagenome TaxID=412755 RepID=A0A0F9GP74_9ZZZZ